MKPLSWLLRKSNQWFKSTHFLPPPKPDDRDWQKDFENKMKEGYHSGGQIKGVK